MTEQDKIELHVQSFLTAANEVTKLLVTNQIPADVKEYLVLVMDEFNKTLRK